MLVAGGPGAAVDRWTPFRRFTDEVYQPPLLVSVRNIARYEAAVGDYQLVLDVQQGRERIPLAIRQIRSFLSAHKPTPAA